MPDFLRKMLPTLIGLGVLFGIVALWMLYVAMSARDIGEVCGDNDCNGIMGEYCIHEGNDSYCSPKCDESEDCPGGWTCERPTEIDQHGGEHQGVTMFCMRPREVFVPSILRSGTAQVSEVSGNVAGVAQGTLCQWRQENAPPGGLDSRWEVTCGDTVIYGGDGSGYNPSADPSWPAGAWVSDTSTTSSDGDPSFAFDGSTMRVHDDSRGPLGEFQVTLTATP